MRTEKAYTRLSRAVQDETGDVASSVEEAAHGLRATKSFGRFDHVVGAFDTRAVRLHDTALERVRVQSQFWDIPRRHPERDPRSSSSASARWRPGRAASPSARWSPSPRS